MSERGACTSDQTDGARAPVLEARRVWKWLVPDRSRPPALREIDLAIPLGSWAAVAGPSGSGKTTLLSLLGALDRPSRGQVLFEGQDLTRLSDTALARTRRRFGFVFQEYSLLERLPLWENVTYPLIPRGVSAGRRRRRAEEVLALVGLAGLAGKRPEELSGGERQRTAIARAIVGAPEVLLADEPTASLDAESAASIRGILVQLHAAGTTVLVATHDPDLMVLADRRYELDGGALVGANESVRSLCSNGSP